MPVTFREAMAQRRANSLSDWPQRGEGNRLEPVARPSFDTGIALRPGSVVMTMGSCFARNIEEYLGAAGHVVPVAQFVAPAEEYGGGTRIAGMLNKYTPAAILQELEWVARMVDEGGRVSFDHVAPFAFPFGDDLFFDMQLASGQPVTRARFVERRQAIFDIHKRFFDCDLAILTPGLTEGWLDTQTGLFIQKPPSRKMLVADPDRFQFDTIGVMRCQAMLAGIVALLKQRGARKIAFSVSPVPLLSTFTARDVLIANTFSKSVLRAAVGEICDHDPEVAYIPSYEAVTLSRSKDVWDDDLRHVTDGFVGRIVSAFMAEAQTGTAPADDPVFAFNSLVSEEDWDGAFALYRDQLAARGDITLPSFHENAAALLLRFRKPDAARVHARAYQGLQPSSPTGYLIEMRVLHKMGHRAELIARAEAGLAACNPLVGRRIALLRDRLTAPFWKRFLRLPVRA